MATKTAKKKTPRATGKRAARRVDPIPEGFTTITPHLVVKDGGAAIAFYTKAFGAKVRGRMDMPDGKLMHAALRIGDTMLMLGEELPGMGSRSPQSLGGTPVTLHLYVRDADKAFARAISAGASVVMPVGDQFWGDRYGIVADPSGHQWSIAARTRELTPAQVRKAGAEMMAKHSSRG